MENNERFDNQIWRTIDEIEDFFDFLEQQKNLRCFQYDYNNKGEDKIAFELFSQN